MTQNQKLFWTGTGLFALAALGGTGYWYFGIYRPAKREQESAGTALISNEPGLVAAGIKTEYSSPVDVKQKTDLFTSLPVGTLPITKGVKSRMAYILQYALNILGQKLEVDGNPGTKTMDAVKKLYGVDAVDRNTVLKIVNDVKKKYVNKSPSLQDSAMLKLAQQYFA